MDQAVIPFIDRAVRLASDAFEETLKEKDARIRLLEKRNEELNEAVKQVTQTKNRLRQLAYYDSLTSLPNRQLFTEQLELLLRVAKREVAEESGFVDFERVGEGIFDVDIHPIPARARNLPPVSLCRTRRPAIRRQPR